MSRDVDTNILSSKWDEAKVEITNLEQWFRSLPEGWINTGSYLERAKILRGNIFEDEILKLLAIGSKWLEMTGPMHIAGDTVKQWQIQIAQKLENLDAAKHMVSGVNINDLNRDANTLIGLMHLKQARGLIEIFEALKDTHQEQAIKELINAHNLVIEAKRLRIYALTGEVEQLMKSIREAGKRYKLKL